MRHSAFTAVYDACVLYLAPLRDFLMWLALSGRFRAKWSMEIHNEWKRNLLKNRPDLTIEQLNRTSELMDVAVPKDFPCSALGVYDIEAQHPDEFVSNLFDLDPAAVVSAAQRQRKQLKMPPIDISTYLDLMFRQGLVQSAKTLNDYRTML